MDTLTLQSGAMDALEALHTRVSSPRLIDPIPTAEELQNIYKAALRAPDHLALRPWRFLVVSGEARDRLGELFAAAAQSDHPEITERELLRERAKPLRAPLLVIAVAVTQAHDTVPEVEQLISTGASVNNMMLAAYSQGIGAMWRTGGMAYHPVVRAGLELSEHERIVGFLYLGQVQGGVRKPPELAVSEFFEEWPRE
jgi:nitroreductase